MLIKIYTLNNNIHIIENVQDVTVYDKSPSDIDDAELYIFDDISVFDEGDNKKLSPKFIEYAKDGVCRALIYNKAYICNNDGKTLEKVVALG